MGALVDTSILVDHLRGRAEARALLERALVEGDPLYASVLSRAEVLAGTRRSVRHGPRGEEEATRGLLDALVWTQITESVADRAAELAGRHRRTTPAVSLVDCLIAATREELDVPLWTRSVRRYPMIEGLVAPY